MLAKNILRLSSTLISLSLALSAMATECGSTYVFSTANEDPAQPKINVNMSYDCLGVGDTDLKAIINKADNTCKIECVKKISTSSGSNICDFLTNSGKQKVADIWNSYNTCTLDNNGNIVWPGQNTLLEMGGKHTYSVD